MESVVMHVASSEEKAIAWCKNNLDIEQKIPERPWWFIISEEEVDSKEILGPPGFKIIGWDGQELNNQPLYGYE